jgi:hypothetical protein
VLDTRAANGRPFSWGEAALVLRLPWIAEAVCLLGKQLVIGLEGTNNKQVHA